MLSDRRALRDALRNSSCTFEQIWFGQNAFILKANCLG